MAITNGYLTLAEVKETLNISDTSDDIQLELSVEAACRAVDDWCGRFFYSASQTRYYTPRSYSVCGVDDLVSVTTVKTDTSGDGTYDTTWSSGDYRLEPFNASTDGRPYRQICTSTVGSYSFPASVAKSVEIVGTFGWPSVPTAVKKAALLQATRLWRRSKDAPLGVVHLPGADGAGGMRLHAKVDPDVQVLLADYRRNVVQVG